MTTDTLDLGRDPSILLVDDDEAFLKRLAKAMERRGFSVEMAGSVAAGKAIATARPPAYAVVDLRLEDGNGLDVVEVLRERRPDSRIVVLTGYGAIATAVAAVKIGATDYLSKPADANDVINALLQTGDTLPPPPNSLPKTRDLPCSGERSSPSSTACRFWKHRFRTLPITRPAFLSSAKRLALPQARIALR